MVEQSLKRCTSRCGEMKPLDRFTPDSRQSDGYRGRCKDCHAAEEKTRRDRCPELTILTLMIQRCYNPNHPKYRYWGGRGIEVCERWRGPYGLLHFLDDVGPRPSAKHEIDRFPNNDGNYEPGNVRWATRKENMLNTRRTRTVTAFNKTLNLDQWSIETGIKRRTLEWRYEQGWPPEQIVRTTLYKFFRKRGDQ